MSHDLSVFVLALAPSALEDGSDLLCLEPGTKIHTTLCERVWRGAHGVMVTCAVQSIRAVSSLLPRVGPLSNEVAANQARQRRKSVRFLFFGGLMTKKGFERPPPGALLKKMRVGIVSGAAFQAKRWRQS